MVIIAFYWVISFMFLIKSLPIVSIFRFLKGRKMWRKINDMCDPVFFPQAFSTETSLQIALHMKVL